MSFRYAATLSMTVIVSLTLLGGAVAATSTPDPGSGLPDPNDVEGFAQGAADHAGATADEAARAANHTADEGEDLAQGIVSEGGDNAHDVLRAADDLIHGIPGQFPQGPHCEPSPADQLLPLHRFCSAEEPGGQGNPGGNDPDDDDNTSVQQQLLKEVDDRLNHADETAGEAGAQAENATHGFLGTVWSPLHEAGQQAGRLLHDVLSHAEHAAGVAMDGADQTMQMALFLAEQAHEAAKDALGGVFNTIEGILTPASSTSEDEDGQGRYVSQSASVETPSAPNLVLGMIVASGVGLALAGMAALRRLLGLGGITLLSRIPSSQIMKNSSRQTIHDIVASDPGVSLNEIVERVGLSRNAVAYHLAVFESEKTMTSVKDGKYRRYFINGGAYVNGAKNVVAAIKNEKTLDVIRYITEHPGVIQKDVCSAVGTSPSATSWHIRRLEKVGLVEKKREANTVRYNPGPNLSRYDLSAFGLQISSDERPSAAVA